VSDSVAMANAFRWVADALRGASTMLQSADPFLGDLGFVRYDWDHVWPLDHERRMHPSRRERWMPFLLFRSYHRPGRLEEEVLSLVAVPFLPDRPAFREAALLASYMEVRDVPDELYLLAASQAWDRGAPLDGVARPVGVDLDLEAFTDTQRRLLDRVAGGRLVSAGRPLMEVRATDDVLALVRAVMAHPDVPAAGKAT
jgi:hypothetical protein